MAAATAAAAKTRTTFLLNYKWFLPKFSSGISISSFSHTYTFFTLSNPIIRKHLFIHRPNICTVIIILLLHHKIRDVYPSSKNYFNRQFLPVYTGYFVLQFRTKNPQIFFTLSTSSFLSFL